MSTDQSIVSIYHGFVTKLSKPGAAIVLQITPEKAALWHAGTGIATESAELLEGVRNLTFLYDLDSADQPEGFDFEAEEDAAFENIFEELGDLLFYLQMARTVIRPADTLVIFDQDASDTSDDSDLEDMMTYWATDIVVLAGYATDLIKKVAAYNKAVPDEDIILALDNIEASITFLAHGLGIAINDLLERNMAKLDIRYAEGVYSDTAAQARADKA